MQATVSSRYSLTPLNYNKVRTGRVVSLGKGRVPGPRLGNFEGIRIQFGDF